jgi:hypothetical protein
MGGYIEFVYEALNWAMVSQTEVCIVKLSCVQMKERAEYL